MVLQISKAPLATHLQLHNLHYHRVGGRRTAATALLPGDLLLQPFYLFKAITGILQQTAHKWPQESGDLCSLHQLSISLKCKSISNLSNPQENKDPFLLFLAVFVAFYHLRQQIRFTQIPFFNANKWTKVCEMCSSCKTYRHVLQVKCASSCWLSHCHWNHHI